MRFYPGQVVNFAKYDSIYQKLIAFGNMIKYGSKGFVHSGVIGEVKKDEVVIYEAIDKGFVKSTYSKAYMRDKIELREIWIGKPTKPLRNVKKHAEKYLGRPYGWFDIFSIVLSLFTRKTEGITGAKHLICSEAVARILYDASDKKIDFVKEFGKSYDLIEPMDLYISKQIRWPHA